MLDSTFCSFIPISVNGSHFRIALTHAKLETLYMNFSTYFRLTSYLTISAAALALFISGGVSAWLVGGFALVLMAGWKLEGTRWQLSERVALIVILASIPVFYFDWRFFTALLLDGFGDPAAFSQGGGINSATGGVARGGI